MSRSDRVRALLGEALADPLWAWSVGAYGAGATLRREYPEVSSAPACGRPGFVAAGGALVLDDRSPVRPVAYETAFGDGWSHAVALCLPEDALPPAGPDRITETGPDRAAIRPPERDRPLFDLGLARPGIAVGLRPATAAARAALDAVLGRSCLAVWPALAGLDADAVVEVPCGRAEVRLAGAGGFRFHLFGRLLRLGRRHAATAPIPAGLVPVMHLHPPHPLGPAGFDRRHHDRFQAVLARFGDPDLTALKRAVWSGGEPAPSSRAGRAAVRVARAQARRLAQNRR
ncbi:hypothetical protein [uncultured Methylobacterium sp.]|jgi:hypothetical protein|uniref:DUF6925 family protein n=1 Tax=uncultured Methylobacterium sp. TaxID=157278 RepID=UPI0026314E72|nr:hypothetical protein [uncultured Methylobacterium sp.]